MPPSQPRYQCRKLGLPVRVRLAEYGLQLRLAISFEMPRRSAARSTVSPVPISVASFASDFDPPSGLVGNQNLVRVAVARKPGEAIPLQGTWIGAAENHLSMNVAVRVTAVDASAELDGGTER